MQYFTIAIKDQQTPNWTLSNALQISNEHGQYFAMCRIDGLFDLIHINTIKNLKDNCTKLCHLSPDSKEIILFPMQPNQQFDIRQYINTIQQLTLIDSQRQPFQVKIHPSGTLFLVLYENQPIKRVNTISYLVDNQQILTASLDPDGGNDSVPPPQSITPQQQPPQSITPQQQPQINNNNTQTNDNVPTFDQDNKNNEYTSLEREQEIRQDEWGQQSQPVFDRMDTTTRNSKIEQQFDRQTMPDFANGPYQNQSDIF